MGVFLDANILFLAARNDGAICRLHSDAFAVEEARRNLAARYPARLSALSEVLDRVELARRSVLAGEKLDAVPLPERDQPALAAGIELSCNVLVTGD